MKKPIIIGIASGTVLAVVIIALLPSARSDIMALFFQNGFTDSQVRECEQAIKEPYNAL